MTEVNSERRDRIYSTIDTVVENHDDVSGLEDIDRIDIDNDWEMLMLTQDHEILVSPDWLDNLQTDELEAVLVHLGLQYTEGVMSDLDGYEQPHVLNLAGNIYNSYIVVHEKGMTLPEEIPVPDEDGTFDDDALDGTISNVHEKSINELYEELNEITPTAPEPEDIEDLDEE